MSYNNNKNQITSDDDDDEEEYEIESWILEFLSAFGNDIFAEVSEDFIEDDFNLTGLSALVPHYHEALEMILDLEPEYPISLPNVALIEKSAELLYGLIHARFIISRHGLNIMAQKYNQGSFGVCPRVLCKGTKLLPTGLHDLPGNEKVRLYCPCCSDIYHPQPSRYTNIDGAFFGTSFVGLFLKTFPDVERDCAERRKKQFQLTLFGFRISEQSRSGPRMRWLRQVPEDAAELDAFATLPEDAAALRRGDNEEDDDDEETGNDRSSAALSSQQSQGLLPWSTTAPTGSAAAVL